VITSEPLAERTDAISNELARLGSLAEQGASDAPSLPDAETDRKGEPFETQEAEADDLSAGAHSGRDLADPAAGNEPESGDDHSVDPEFGKQVEPVEPVTDHQPPTTVEPGIDEEDLPHVALPSLPHVAEKQTPKNVLPFATRGKSGKAKAPAKSKSKLATRGKSSRPPKVEDVKASKGTWAFRLRWNSFPGRPVIYVSRVADSTYDLIKKGNYENFKEQLISSYGESTLRASNGA
jgi:hypothetical protein